MPQPTMTQSHVDKILTNISVAYVQDQKNFIANQVFPEIKVDKKSDKYFVYTKNDWFRDEVQRRADATESAGSGYNLGTDNYSTEDWALHKDVGDKTLKNSDAPLSPLSDASTFVASRMLLRREIQFVTDFFGTGIWGTDVTGVTSVPAEGTSFRKWNDYSQGQTYDPANDVEYGKEKVLSTTGFLPNTLVLGYRAFRALKRHPVIRDQIKYTSSANVSVNHLQDIMDVERILVAKAVKATNAEGVTGAYSFAFGDAALLCYVNPTPSLMQPSAGYTFSWTGVSDGLGETIGTSQFRMEHLKATRVESEASWDNKVVGSDLGFFFNSVV